MTMTHDLSIVGQKQTKMQLQVWQIESTILLKLYKLIKKKKKHLLVFCVMDVLQHIPFPSQGVLLRSKII